MSRFSRHLGFLGLAALLAGGCTATLSERDEYIKVHAIKVMPAVVAESELAQAPVIGVAVFTKPVYARLAPRTVLSDSGPTDGMDQ
ncbi:MAG: hypothetical protein AABZ53_15405 [Planctomycetota bacterium]